MIADRIERLVEDTATTVRINVAGIDFSCSPMFNGDEQLTGVIWRLPLQEPFDNGDRARELFEFMIQSKCKHNHTAPTSSGGMQHIGGELVDDTVQSWMCLDCGKELDEQADGNVPDDGYELPI